MLNLYPLNSAELNQPISAGVVPPGGLVHRATGVVWEMHALEVNTVVVYGEAVDGSLVWGQACDPDEVARTGYRLDIVTEPAIPTTLWCTSVASAIIEKMGLQKLKGTLQALPNCGLEIFDVVQITDSHTNLDRGTFRVAASTLFYERTQGIIVQTLNLQTPW